MKISSHPNLSFEFDNKAEDMLLNRLAKSFVCIEMCLFPVKGNYSYNSVRADQNSMTDQKVWQLISFLKKKKKNH